ncbi:hypothetical protein N0V84_007176 [Fusarium piperis]|uniref:Hydroxyneurosporene synthase n=1 Tax=Fusarium piperis TaxID=1435070 RepID=A0A9W9BMS5_9HYPO|nr:hypothetical protein N0V84_007176 [Fusarium piperis]
MFTNSFLLRSLTGILALTPLINASKIIVPPEPADGPSVVQWISKADGLDNPKVLPINRTTFDWWYFDLVAQDAGLDEKLQSVVVVFWLATDGGFPPLAPYRKLGYTSVDLVQVTASFANGTVFRTFLNGSQAVFSTNGNAATGAYAGPDGKASFRGEADLSAYTVNINAPEVGVVGTIHLDSVAPPHYPGGPAKKGQNMQIAPHIGWANGIPDANGKASLLINGQKWAFKGLGYHDKNWGDAPLPTFLNSWYWGHCRLGDYSIVWFDYLDVDGKNSVSSYVSKRNKILVASTSGIKVRPFGQNSTYPPLMHTGAPTGFHIDVQIPKGTLSFNVTGDNIVGGASGALLTRWTGFVNGGLNGANDLTGTAMYEQFALAT